MPVDDPKDPTYHRRALASKRRGLVVMALFAGPGFVATELTHRMVWLLVSCAAELGAIVHEVRTHQR